MFPSLGEDLKVHLIVLIVDLGVDLGNNLRVDQVYQVYQVDQKVALVVDLAVYLKENPKISQSLSALKNLK